jgi:hypothetical protein
MRRFLIALIAGGIVYGLVPGEGVAVTLGVIVFLGAWVALHVISPGVCPHCGKRVKFLYDTCHHCGRRVKEP